MRAGFSAKGGGAIVPSQVEWHETSHEGDELAAAQTRNSPGPTALFDNVVAFAIEVLPLSSGPGAIRATFGLTQGSYYSILTYALSRPDTHCDSTTRRQLLDLCAQHRGSR